MKISNHRAISLIEFMIALVLVGTFMTMAIPKYVRNINRTVEKQAAVNLKVMTNAVKQYYIDNGAYPADLNNVAAINTTFGLAVIPYNVTYRCLFGGWLIYECRANSTSGGWGLHADGIWQSGTPHCLSGTCPLCTTSGCPYFQ